METDERLTLIEKRQTMIENEIEKIQKDIQILGENCKVEIPCFNMFENSLTKKLMKEPNETSNSIQTVSS